MSKVGWLRKSKLWSSSGFSGKPFVCISWYFLTDLTSTFSFRGPQRLLPAFRGTFWQIWHQLFPTEAIHITCISWDVSTDFYNKNQFAAFTKTFYATFFSLRSNLIAAPLDRILFTLFWPLHKEIIDFKNVSLAEKQMSEISLALATLIFQKRKLGFY